MRDVGILMRAEMVQAILRPADEQPKTVTRRTRGLEEINADPDAWELIGFQEEKGRPHATFRKRGAQGSLGIPCPYGDEGNHLWVRENIAIEPEEGGVRVVWEADRAAHYFDVQESAFAYTGTLFYLASNYRPRRWRPSIHMPRWACRITLGRTSNRLPERLQAITEEDAIREGFGPQWEDPGAGPCPDCKGAGVYPALGPGLGMTEADCHTCDTPQKRFRLFFQAINGPQAWDRNEWVWPVEFSRLPHPIYKE